MFEKWRIKEHMDVADSTGRHIGTVDEIEDNQIKLTRSDSSDGTHHYVDLDSVDRIEDDRVYLKQGTPLPSMGRSDDQLQSTTAGGSAGMSSSQDFGTGSGGMTSGGGMSGGTGSGSAAEDAAMGGQTANTGGSPAAQQAIGGASANADGSEASTDLPGYEDKLFGTSGTGTGMGGSGRGEH